MTFSTNMRRLGQKIGTGTIKGEFHVDGGERTVPLEVGYWRNHMGRNGHVPIRNYNDGGPHAAQRSLEVAYERSMRDIADGLFEEGTVPPMIRHVERVNAAFQTLAPRRTGQYRESTLRIVRDKGRFAYHQRGASYGQEPTR